MLKVYYGPMSSLLKSRVALLGTSFSGQEESQKIIFWAGYSWDLVATIRMNGVNE